MRRSNALPAVLLTLAVLAAACTSDAGGGADAGATETPPTCDPALDEALAAWGRAGFSGSFATSVDGEVACRAAVGLADPRASVPNAPETVFEVGSITKTFTAAAIFGLIDAGDLALDDRAGALVPELTGPVTDVTVEQLLLHTSGLAGAHGTDHQPLGREQAIAAISELELAFEPGTDEAYANAGYTLLALIVEAVAGEPYRAHMASTVLPLPGGEVAGGFWDGEPAAPGPRAVGELDDGSRGEVGDAAGPHWALDGNGGLAMTVPQLAAWTAAFFAGDVVSADAVADMSAGRVELGDGQAATYGWVALDASVFGEPALASAGGGGDVGHDAITVWLPDSRRVIAAASNTPDVTAEDLVEELGPALAAGEALPQPDAAAPTVDPGDLTPMAGTYRLAGNATIEVTVDGAALVLQPSGGEALVALFPRPDDDGPVAEHEAKVLALLGGATAEGRSEREALAEDLGAIDDVALVGTIDEGELHTYVAITAGGATTTAWYALEEGGSIAAVEIGPLPSLRVVATSATTFRPERASDAVATAVAVDGDRLVIAAGAATVTARRDR